MTRASGGPLENFDPEIERTLHRCQRVLFREQAPMVEEQAPVAEEQAPVVEEQAERVRPLMDYANPLVAGPTSSIRRPPVAANNFEIKPAVIHLIQSQVQFSGLQNEDPNTHIRNFLEICNTIKYNGVTDDAIRLRLFPFSLRDKSKAWLNSLPAGSITTWDMMVQKFLAKYFPPSKTAKMQNDITNFAQFEGESMYEA